MPMRHDALAGAAEIVLAIERIAKEYAADNMVATVGRIEASPGATNVIAGRVGFSLELRSATDAMRKAAIEQIRGEAQRIGAAAQARSHLRAVPRNRDHALRAASAGLCSRARSVMLGLRAIQLAVRRRSRRAGHGAALSVGDAVRALPGRDQPQSGGICERGGYRALRPRRWCASSKCSRQQAAGRGMSDFIEANFPREVEFLKALVRVPSDNPPGDCAPPRGGIGAPARRARLYGRAPQRAGRRCEATRHGVRDQPDRTRDASAAGKGR